tara:strand:+ start:86 stop:541 length:456 start_codon:yes stop_codon:yes gene_type:complete
VKGNIFIKSKAKVKNYMTNKNLERFEKSRSKKLGKPYVPASKKNKGFKKYDSSYKRTESPFTPFKKEKEGFFTQKEGKKQVAKKGVLKGAKKVATRVGGTVASGAARFLNPLGAALGVATFGKFVHKEEVGKKAIKNIRKGKGKGTFLGKA